jgi:multiple sugar transport system permease protein
MAAISQPKADAKPSGLTWRQRLTTRRSQEIIFILIVIAPMILCFVLFWIYPMIRGAWGSVTDWRGFNPNQPFVGLKHYVALFNDPIFIKALKNTFLYALFYLPANIVIGLILALAVEATGALRGFYRTTYFMPVVTSSIATALIWSYLYQPSFGLINQVLQILGLPAQSFLKSTTQALPSIAVYAIWKGVGFTMVLFMAGLSAIDRSYYDAAKVDGANSWQSFWRITLPLLQPTMVFVLITGVIGTLQVFGPIYVMSSGGDGLPGGPANSTMVVSVYQWLMAFRELELGYGSAMGMVLFFIILALTLFQVRFLRRRWDY